MGCLYLLPTLFLVPCVEALAAFKSACWHKDAKIFLGLEKGCEGEERCGGEDSASVCCSPCLLQTKYVIETSHFASKVSKEHEF